MIDEDSIDRRDVNSNDKDLQRRKKKSAFNTKEVHSDGYDTDGYKDEDDRTKLSEMSEVEREKILTKRMEERNNKKFYDNVAEKAEKVKTTGITTSSTVGAEQSISGVDASKKNQVEKDRIQHKKELETRREKYKESHSHQSQNDYTSSSYHDEQKHHSSGLAQHQRERNTESDEFQKIVKQLTLSNDFLNKLILRSNFKELAKGAYVKVKIGTKYEIYKIENVNNDNSACIFSLFNGIKRRDMDLKFISNQNADQVELCTYYEQNYRHEELSKIQDKKKKFDELLTKKQDKSEKEKFAEIDKTITQKIEQGFFENTNNLNASELQTYSDFLRDRLLETENQENNHNKLNKLEIEKLHKEKLKLQHNMDFIAKKIKLVKHQFVPIFTKNVLATGSKISELALNKKNAKIKDKALIRRQKIQRLQQPYFAFEEQFKMLSQFTSSVQFKEEIKQNHIGLKLSSNVSQDIFSIDCSDQAMQALIVNKK